MSSTQKAAKCIIYPGFWILPLGVVSSGPSYTFVPSTVKTRIIRPCAMQSEISSSGKRVKNTLKIPHQGQTKKKEKTPILLREVTITP